MIKNSILTAAALAAVFLPSSSFAESKEGGNGGGAIWCERYDNEQKKLIHSAELLDLFEARALRSLESDLGDKNEDYKIKVGSVLKNLSRVAPIRSRKYQDLYKAFDSEQVMVSDVDMTYIPDALNSVIPSGCSMRQVVIQKVPEFPGDKRYTINKNIWDLLDNNSKAALVIHEILYNEGIELGFENSKGVRFLTGIITSTKLKTLNEQKFGELVRAAGYKATDRLGTMVEQYEHGPGSFGFNEDQSSYFAAYRPRSIKFRNFIFGHGFLLQVNNFKVITAQAVSHFKNQGIEATSDSGFNLRFAPTGKLDTIEISNGKQIQMKFASWMISGEGIAIKFDENEKPVKISGRNIQTTNPSLKYKSAILELHNDGIEPNGVILQGSLAEDTELMTPQGPLTFTSNVSNGHTAAVLFDPTGKIVIEGCLLANQKVKTKEGYVVTENNMILKFDSEGSATLQKVW